MPKKKKRKKASSRVKESSRVREVRVDSIFWSEKRHEATFMETAAGWDGIVSRDDVELSCFRRRWNGFRETDLRDVFFFFFFYIGRAMVFFFPLFSCFFFSPFPTLQNPRARKQQNQKAKHTATPTSPPGRRADVPGSWTRALSAVCVCGFHGFRTTRLRVLRVTL